MLGAMYSFGLGVPRNNERAFSRFSKTPEQGLAEAKYEVRAAYIAGLGVARRDRLGFELVVWPLLRETPTRENI